MEIIHLEGYFAKKKKSHLQMQQAEFINYLEIIFTNPSTDFSKVVELLIIRKIGAFKICISIILQVRPEALHSFSKIPT